MTKDLTELLARELNSVTGGGIREWSFGALTALSVGMGTPAGEKLSQPSAPAPIVMNAGRR